MPTESFTITQAISDRELSESEKQAYFFLGDDINGIGWVELGVLVELNYIDTTNDHCDIARRSKNKQKRNDLRQLGLAMVVSK